MRRFLLPVLLALPACGPDWECGEGCLAEGPFEITWSDDVLTVVQADLGVTVWETAPGAPILGAAWGEEEVEYGAGSFVFEDRITGDCGAPDAGTFARGEEGLPALTGGFEACELTYSLEYNRSDDTWLAFTLRVDPAGGEPPDRLSLSWAHPGGPRFGFGVQYDAVDLGGRDVPIWCQEQGSGRGLEPLSSWLGMGEGNPAGDWHTTYSCVPWAADATGRGVLLDHTGYLHFDLTAPDRDTATVWATELRGGFVAARDPLEALEGLTARTGRMEPLPGWTQEGGIVRLSGGAGAVREKVRTLREGGAPPVAVWVEDWCGTRETALGTRMWWNWEVDRALYPDWEDLLAELRADGTGVLVYFNPFLVDVSEKEGVTRNLWAEARDAGWLVRTPAGEPYAIESGGFSAGLVDLTSAEARTWLQAVIREQVDAGVAGWMADFSEALPWDAVLHDGSDPQTYHNRYPYEWARLHREVVDGVEGGADLLFFNRSGNTASPGVARLFWLGDQLVTWDGYDGFQTVVPALLSAGLSGWSLEHADTGGYLSVDSLGMSYVRSKELLLRWIELSAFTPLLRTHSTNLPDLNWQVDSDAETLAAWARFADVFAALAPYRATLMDEAATRGWPLVRHPLLHWPDDPEVWALEQEFLLGPDLLVAPVVTEGATTVDLYLPAGRWVHLWSGVAWGEEATGSHVTVDAPVGEPAVFYREGSPWGEALRAEVGP